MQLMLKPNSPRQATRSRLHQLAILFLAGILALQLIGSAFHKHDLAEDHADCVSCYIAAHFPPGVPPVTAEMPPTPSVLYYPLLTLRTYFYLVGQSFLVPPSHAPPALLSSL
jgi:hypothetical protein